MANVRVHRNGLDILKFGLFFTTYLKRNDERITVLFTSGFPRKKERERREKNLM